MKNKFLTLLGTSLLVSLLAGPAVANNKKSIVDFARVTYVEPIYRYVTVHEPQRQCEYVRPVRERHHNNRRYTHGSYNYGQRRFISGESIVHKNTAQVNYSNKVNSVESLRRQQSNRINSVESLRRHNRNTRRNSNRRAGNHQTRLVERCVTTTVSRQERRHDGYNVTYVYRGNTFQTRTDQHPGNRIRVRVQVRPH